jgi:hypothetical protein
VFARRFTQGYGCKSNLKALDLAKTEHFSIFNVLHFHLERMRWRETKKLGRPRHLQLGGSATATTVMIFEKIFPQFLHEVLNC